MKNVDRKIYNEFMGEINTNFVCFECREARRILFEYEESEKKCLKCGIGMKCIGTNRRVPRKTHRSGWRRLKKEYDRIYGNIDRLTGA